MMRVQVRRCELSQGVILAIFGHENLTRDLRMWKIHWKAVLEFRKFTQMSVLYVQALLDAIFELNHVMMFEREKSFHIPNFRALNYDLLA